MPILPLLLFLILVVPLPVSAQGWDDPAPALFVFQGIGFGEPPSADMICTRGDCPPGRESLTVNPHPEILTSYRRSVDLTHLAGVAISAPEYDFFDNRLTRIKFYLQCEAESAQACIEAVEFDLRTRYQATFLEEFHIFQGAGEEHRGVRCAAEPGIFIDIHQFKRAGRWLEPIVKISDHALMEEARRAAYPDYISRSGYFDSRPQD